MAEAARQDPAPDQAPDPAPAGQQIVVVGGGPVGMRAANALAQRGHDVTVLSAEPFQPYNRVRLTPLLGGEAQFGEIALPHLQPAETSGRLICLTGRRVAKITPEFRFVTTADGERFSYDTLILATGSRAFVPSIPGAGLAGVFTFRTAADASALLARSFSARNVVVIGGGLLGLEAARGMRRRGAEVTVIEHESRLMPRQLDVGAGALLKTQIERLGVAVRTGVAVREITGTHKVDGLRLADGTDLICDTVIICTGVRANTALALDAALPIGRGIVVNDRMQTADPDIYAIGECVEHRGQMYGLVGPGYEQADVAVAAIDGDAGDAFTGSLSATKLKVIGAEVFSVGAIEQLEAALAVRSLTWKSADGYRRIFVKDGKLVGAIAIGTWDQASQVQSGCERGATVYPWMLYRFRKTGNLWGEGAQEVAGLPDAATVCNCTGVTCGRLRGAIAGGCDSPDALGVETGAGTVCGSCTPLLEELLDSGAPPKAQRLWRPVLALSALAGLVALALAAMGRIPFSLNFDPDSLRVWLWRDNIVKQWTGFILLGLTLCALVIGLRKRLRFMDRLGGYDFWRLAHLVIGAAAAIGLVVHTGLRPGANLNLALFVMFTATLVFGAIAGLATGGDHLLRARRIGTARKPPRTLPTWVHILLVWPLPVLILIHVLASYAY